MTATAAALDRGYRFTDVGMHFTRELSKHEWIAVGRRLSGMVNGAQWGIGDWLIYGEGSGKYGATYTVASEVTGFTYKTLCTFASVSKAFPLEARSYRLSWSHYREALRLGEDQRAEHLRKAQEYFWSCDQFAKHVDVITARTQDAAALNIEEAPATLRRSSRWRQKTKRVVRCPHCHRTFRLNDAESA